MLQLRPWKVILVVLAAVFGIYFTLPNLLPAGTFPSWAPQPKLNLGLDLQGGSYLLLEVDTAALNVEKLNNLIEDVRRELQTKRIAFSGLGVAGGAVSVRITDPAQVEAARTELNKLAQPLTGATGGRDMTVTRGADQTITMRPVAEAAAAEAVKAVDQSIEIVRRRIDQLGTREPAINRQGKDRIVVQAPGESDPERLRRVIGQTAKLSFQMVDDSVPVAEAQAGRIPPGSILLPEDNPSEPMILVKRRIEVSGDMLTSAQASFDQYQRPVVSFRFNGQGTRRFGDISTKSVGKRFAIVLDTRVISAPVINEPLTGGSGQISGNFTTESANDLSVLLRAGALPAPLKVQEQRTVGAELGADAVRAGQISLGIGAVAIIVFMVLAYGLFGIFASIALIVNVMLIIGLMSLTQATLTLPGIAGLVLTLAVAVDANVLIYERTRDEARAGRSPISALEHGYARAMVSIMDANVTSLIAALIMFQFGAGAVRGFAWTLSIGVFTSLFTAILITQVLIGWWLRVARPKTLPI